MGTEKFQFKHYYITAPSIMLWLCSPEQVVATIAELLNSGRCYHEDLIVLILIYSNRAVITIYCIIISGKTMANGINIFLPIISDDHVRH